jgi:hypothetical protein
MYRIEQFVDNFERFGFLREVNGDLNPSEQDSYVVLGREYGPDNRVTRAWFLSTESMNSDGQGVGKIPHRVVSAKIVPGEPSQAPDPTARGIGGIGAETLSTLKKAQLRRDKEAQQFTTYCREWNQHLAKIAEQSARIQQLESDLNTADGNVRNLAERNATIADELQSTKAQLESLRAERTLTHRVREWGRSWSTRRE